MLPCYIGMLLGRACWSITHMWVCLVELVIDDGLMGHKINNKLSVLKFTKSVYIS